MVGTCGGMFHQIFPKGQAIQTRTGIASRSDRSASKDKRNLPDLAAPKFKTLDANQATQRRPLQARAW